MDFHFSTYLAVSLLWQLIFWPRNYGMRELDCLLHALLQLVINILMKIFITKFSNFSSWLYQSFCCWQLWQWRNCNFRSHVYLLFMGKSNFFCLINLIWMTFIIRWNRSKQGQSTGQRLQHYHTSTWCLLGVVMYL